MRYRKGQIVYSTEHLLSIPMGTPYKIVKVLDSSAYVATFLRPNPRGHYCHGILKENNGRYIYDDGITSRINFIKDKIKFLDELPCKKDWLIHA